MVWTFGRPPPPFLADAALFATIRGRCLKAERAEIGVGAALQRLAHRVDEHAVAVVVAVREMRARLWIVDNNYC